VHKLRTYKVAITEYNYANIEILLKLASQYSTPELFTSISKATVSPPYNTSFKLLNLAYTWKLEFADNIEKEIVCSERGFNFHEKLNEIKDPQHKLQFSAKLLTIYSQLVALANFQ